MRAASRLVVTPCSRGVERYGGGPPVFSVGLSVEAGDVDGKVRRVLSDIRLGLSAQDLPEWAALCPQAGVHGRRLPWEVTDRCILSVDMCGESNNPGEKK